MDPDSEMGNGICGYYSKLGLTVSDNTCDNDISRSRTLIGFSRVEEH